MFLVEVGFMHYGPKSQEDGIKELIITGSMEQAVAYIDKEYLFNNLENYVGPDPEAEGEYFSPCNAWWDKNPHKKDEALNRGLTLSGYGDVQGSYKEICLWWEGDDWKDPEDCYYGVTQYSWRNYQEISEEDAAVLIRLGLAKDIR